MTVFRKYVQEFIDKFRFNVKRDSLVQSRIKMLEKFSELLDFGPTREFRPGFVNNYLCIMDCAAEQGRAGVLQHSRQLGFLTGSESAAINQAHVQSVMLLAQVECNNINIDIRHSSLPEDFI